MKQLDEICNLIKKDLTDELEFKDNISDEELEHRIFEMISSYGSKEYISHSDRFLIGKKILNSMRRLDILQELVDDNSVTEIMINGPNEIFVERNGRIYKTDKKFESEEKLRDIITQIVSECNRVVNDSSPIVDARLKNGSRVNVVLNPIAINGPIMTIRRFPDTPFSMDQLINIGSISVEAAELLKKLVVAGYNIIVSGGTGSGKTTFLNALSAYIPRDERIITIEDSAELQIQGIDNLVRMETKNANIEGCKPIVIRDLIKTSLRMRPNRIIVGEVRGAEAMDMICSAMNCGHDGSMSTVHANSAKDTIGRLETMILTAVDLPLGAIKRQICSGVDIVIQLGRLRDKSRKVLEISEIDRIENGEIIFNELYRFEEEDMRENMQLKGSLKRVGKLKHEEKLQSAGIKI